MTRTPPRTFTLCCIVDQHPRFYVEFVLWMICVRRYLPAAFRTVVYSIGKTPADLLDWAEQAGARIVERDPLVASAPHCNKIIPFFDGTDDDHVIVTDTDLFFVADIAPLLTNDRYRAAPNNHCNPPPRIFQAVLAASGLGRPYRPGLALFAGQHGLRETHINNISAGIVAAPRARAAELAERWHNWARWLVENRSLLEGWAVHVDQVAFALAMEDLREDVEFLPPHANTILQLLGEISTFYAIHLTTGHIPQFPERFRPDRTIVADGLDDGVGSAVNRLNDAIRAASEVIGTLASTRGHHDKFLNPAWTR